jgi:hypothetical protein
MHRSAPDSIAGRLTLAASIALLLVFDNCGAGAPDLPNSISDEEYSVYSAWITHAFKEQPPRLLLSSRTFIFDPLSPMGCSKALETNRHVSPTLLRALHRLGEAEFPVHTGKLQLPWKFEESEGLTSFPALTPPFLLIAFSRVAFNRDKTQALFAVSNVCGGLCGGGGPILVTRKAGHWSFSDNLGCVWKY